MLNFLLIMACAYLVGAWILFRADRRGSSPEPVPVVHERHRVHRSQSHYKPH